MKPSRLHWITFVQLFLRFLLNSLLRTLRRGLITAGILSTLALVYWSHRPFQEKTLMCVLVFVVASLYLIYCGYMGLPGFAEFRRHIAAKTKKPDLYFELAGRDRNARVRAEAAKRLTDQKVLEEIARTDESVNVRAAAGGLDEPDNLLDIVAGSNDLEMWRGCFPFLVPALLAKQQFRQRVSAAAYGSDFADELLRQPVCKYCYGWVEAETRESWQWPEEDVYEPDSKQKEKLELIRYEVDCCRYCTRESTVGFSVRFSSFLTEAEAKGANI